jgi:hypothetical protein
MRAIVWNPTGFHVINVLGKGRKFNTTDYITEGFSSLVEWRRNQIRASDRKLIIHADNTHPHTARISVTFLDENDMTKAPHSPSSPNLAPSDFSLFGHVKQFLRADFPNQDSFFGTMVQISGSIKSDLE